MSFGTMINSGAAPKITASSTASAFTPPRAKKPARQFPPTPSACFPSLKSEDNLSLAMLSLQARLQSVLIKTELFRGLPKTHAAAIASGEVLNLANRVNRDLDWFIDAEHNVRAGVQTVRSLEQRELLQEQLNAILNGAVRLPSPGQFHFDPIASVRGLPRETLEVEQSSPALLLLEMEAHQQAVHKRLIFFSDFHLDLETAVDSGEIEVIRQDIRFHIKAFDEKKNRFPLLLEKVEAPEKRAFLQEQYDDILRRAAQFPENTVHFNFEIKTGEKLSVLNKALGDLENKVAEFLKGKATWIFKRSFATALLNEIEMNILPLFLSTIEESNEANQHTGEDVFGIGQRERFENLRRRFSQMMQNLVCHGILKPEQIPHVPCFYRNVEVLSLQNLLGFLLRLDEEELDRNFEAYRNDIHAACRLLPEQLQRRMDELRSPYRKGNKHRVIDIERCLYQALETLPQYKPESPSFELERLDPSREALSSLARHSPVLRSSTTDPSLIASARKSKEPLFATHSPAPLSSAVDPSIVASARKSNEPALALRSPAPLSSSAVDPSLIVSARKEDAPSRGDPIDSLLQQRVMTDLLLGITNLISTYHHRSRLESCPAPSKEDVLELIQKARNGVLSQVEGQRLYLDPALEEQLHHFSVTLPLNSDIPEYVHEVQRYINALTHLLMMNH